jgi:hypothetical protein
MATLTSLLRPDEDDVGLAALLALPAGTLALCTDTHFDYEAFCSTGDLYLTALRDGRQGTPATPALVDLGGGRWLLADDEGVRRSTASFRVLTPAEFVTLSNPAPQVQK